MLNKTAKSIFMAGVAFSFMASPVVQSAEKSNLKAQLEEMAKKDKKKILSIVDKAKDAIMQVEISWVLSISQGGKKQPDRDVTIPINGTCVTKDGKIIVSYSVANPAAQAPGLAAKGVTLVTKVKAVKVFKEDGTELKAKIVIEDPDRDIMVIQINDKKQNLPFIELKKDTNPTVLDTIIAPSRMSKKDNRIALVNTSRITGIIKKTMTYYISASASPTSLPAIDKDNNCFGLYLNRKGKIAGSSVFILPAIEILDVLAELEDE